MYIVVHGNKIKWKIDISKYLDVLGGAVKKNPHPLLSEDYNIFLTEKRKPNDFPFFC
jgi:hypothetical protein